MSEKKNERLARTILYESDWVSLYGDRVRLPDGTVLDRYHVVHIPKEAALAIVENDRGELLVVRIHRYPLDVFQWEFPSGRMEPGEEIIEAAAREALEESGYETTAHRVLCTYYAAPGVSDLTHHIVACRAGRKVGEPDPKEVGEVRWMTKAALWEMVRRNELTDGYTLTAFLLYAQWDGGAEPSSTAI